MLGAIIGDIVGSPYELEANNIKTIDFPLFSSNSHFTDDTVMTVAVAEGLINGCNDYEKTELQVIRSMRRLGREYPNAGYGYRFNQWLYSDTPQPYNSFGNGSAMRVSSVAWLYHSIAEVRHFAKLTAKVTHNHPQGIKGAEATAAAIFLARQGRSKSEIKKYIEAEFEYNLNRTCDEIRPAYVRSESCQETVPQAITAFLEGDSFENAVRLAVSLGGDSDTIAAIAGSIAEGFYGIPENIRTKGLSLLDDNLKDKVMQLYKYIYGNA